MKKVLAVAATASAMVLALGLAACSSGGSEPTPAEEASAAVEEVAAETSAAVEETQAAVEEAGAAVEEAVAEAATLAAADLAAVTDTVEFGDYDGMQALSKAIQNGEKVGAVVEVDGMVSNFAKGMSYSIVEENADGSGNIGTVFKIEGVDEDAYPSDGTHVKLTGLVVDDGGMMFTIHTLPEFVEVLE